MPNVLLPVLPGTQASPSLTWVADGDSITFGDPVGAAHAYPAICAPLLGNGIALRNVAVAGQNAKTLDLTHFSAAGGPASWITTSPPTMYSLMIGVNDINNPDDAATIWGHIASVLTKARAAGATYIVLYGTLPSNGTIGADQTKRSALLALETAHWRTYADAFVVPRWATAADIAPWTGDGTHPTLDGQAAIAWDFISVVDTLL